MYHAGNILSIWDTLQLFQLCGKAFQTYQMQRLGREASL